MPERPLTLALLAALAPGPALAQFGQASPHTLELNHTFYFNGDKAAYAQAPDCRDWAGAMRAFDALREAGKTVTAVRGRDAAASFVEHAYKDRVRGVQYRDLESVFVVATGADAFRVYTGNEAKGVVCGFDRPQTLDRVWFEAGLQGKDVPVTPRPTSPLDPLRSAYLMESYGLVRHSLQQRGYTALAAPEPVAERCKPATERLCETYPEAFCDNDMMAGMSCTFVFKRDGTDQVIGVDASVTGLTRYGAQIEVTDLRELGVDR